MTLAAETGGGDYDPEYVAGLVEIIRAVRAQMAPIVHLLREVDPIDMPPVPSKAANRATPAMLVLRPGDKVLVTLVDDPTQGEANDLAATLRGSFPGVQFTVIGGVAGICVQT